MKPQHIRAPCQLNAEKFDFTIKIILIGDLRVGKTTFLHRYLTGQYNAHLKQNDGIGARTKVIERDGRRILLRLWDTAGQERFRSLTSSHYRDVQGCLIMYDVTQSQSFDNVQRWYHDLQDKSDPTPKAVLVGTKCHLYREVDRERAERLAENLEVPYVEASAELGLNVMEAFETLLQQIVVCLEERAARIKLSKEDNEKTEKWKCGCGCG